MEYAVYDEWIEIAGIREILRMRDGRDLWSARLSTGTFGFAHCGRGKRLPKGTGEIVFGIGDNGLNALVDLGLAACVACKPQTPGVWQKIAGTVQRKYALGYDGFLDRSREQYDARRVEWESVLPITLRTPHRLYVPEGLEQEELAVLRGRFSALGFTPPQVGWMDRHGRFNEYGS